MHNVKEKMCYTALDFSHQADALASVVAKPGAKVPIASEQCCLRRTVRCTF